MRKLVGLMVVALLVMGLAVTVQAQPRPMAEDVFTPLAKGYDMLREGKYEAAEFQFKTALSRDTRNPFALNNLAAIEEKKGKLKDAVAYLEGATMYAKDYLDKVEQTCFVGGLCNAVKPVQILGTESAIAPIVAENLKKLKEKVAATPMPPEPSTPPKMK